MPVNFFPSHPPRFLIRRQHVAHGLELLPRGTLQNALDHFRNRPELNS